MAELKDIKKPVQSVDQMEAEIKAAELQLKQLEILEKQANLQDLRERLDERQLKRDDKSQKSRNNGQTLKQIEAQNKLSQAHCNHRKGGNGIDGFVNGEGDDPQYAVLKHQFFNADVWVRCLRCAKTWKPPVKIAFYFNERGESVAPQDGKFDQAKYEQAWKEYKEALAFPTKNSQSGSYQFRFESNDPKVNAQEVVREQMLPTTLR